MTIIDYVIIAVVIILFILAFIMYKKKPHCSCGRCDECLNCTRCNYKINISNKK